MRTRPAEPPGRLRPVLKGTFSLTRRPDQRGCSIAGHAVRSSLRGAPPRDRVRSSERGSRNGDRGRRPSAPGEGALPQVGRPKLRRIDKAFLAACSRVLPRHRWGSFIVAPTTLMRWHRELVRRKWTYKQNRLGRPPIDPAVAALICRMARENPRWGYMRIKGECRKLGVSVAATTVKKVLRAAGLEPTPRRDGPSWSEFLRAQAQGIWACDFFTIETASLRTLDSSPPRAVPLDAPMLFSLLYMVLRGVLRLAPAGDERDREAEILVLRHQVKVLKRKACPKGTQTSDRAQAASSYSWMRPPNTSLLRMRAPEACGAGSGRGTGVLRSRPRWGLRALYLHENGRRGRLNERRTFT